MIKKTVFMRDQSKFLMIFLSTVRKLYQKILIQKWGERIFSYRQLRMRVYIRLAMIMVFK